MVDPIPSFRAQPRLIRELWFVACRINTHLSQVWLLLAVIFVDFFLKLSIGCFLSSNSAVVSTLAGSFPIAAGFVNGVGTASSFSTPFYVAVDHRGVVIVSDFGNNAIRRISSPGLFSFFFFYFFYFLLYLFDFSDGAQSGNIVTTYGNTSPYTNPYGVTIVTNGVVFVADTLVNVVRRISTAGSFLLFQSKFFFFLSSELFPFL